MADVGGVSEVSPVRPQEQPQEQSQGQLQKQPQEQPLDPQLERRSDRCLLSFANQQNLCYVASAVAAVAHMARVVGSKSVEVEGVLEANRVGGEAAMYHEFNRAGWGGRHLAKLGETGSPANLLFSWAHSGLEVFKQFGVEIDGRQRPCHVFEPIPADDPEALDGGARLPVRFPPGAVLGTWSRLEQVPANSSCRAFGHEYQAAAVMLVHGGHCRCLLFDGEWWMLDDLRRPSLQPCAGGLDVVRQVLRDNPYNGVHPLLVRRELWQPVGWLKEEAALQMERLRLPQVGQHAAPSDGSRKHAAPDELEVRTSVLG